MGSDIDVLYLYLMWDLIIDVLTLYLMWDLINDVLKRNVLLDKTLSGDTLKSK